MEEYVPCFSCNAKSLNIEGETHKYMLSSPGCWAMYCELLEKEYSDFRLASVHHYTVDAYACQHPGEKKTSQAYKSVGIHLSCLHMFFQHGMELKAGGKFKDHFAQYNKQKGFINWLEPPTDMGLLTVYDLWNTEGEAEYRNKAREWAHATWKAWNVHLPTVEVWIQDFLTSTNGSFKLS